MSCSPPHKRHLKDPSKPSPVPDSLQTNFENKLYSSLRCENRYGIIFSGGSISKWFLIGPYGIEDDIPPYVELVPVASDSAERRNRKKTFVLDFPEDNNMNTEESKEEDRTQWQLVAENVVDDLVRAYERAKKKMEEHRHVLRLVVRSGKIFFYGKYLNNMFSTDVPTSYLQHIKSKVAPSHGFCIDLEKDTYVVKVSHCTGPNSTISCKCTVNEDGRLSMYKAELNPVRHLVVDVSCIDKNFDMRLMLAAKRNITSSLSEKETSDIKSLLDSATVDPNVKGGLKWPLGETLPADGYKVLDVCHVRSTIYRNGTLKLRVRETDRFNETIGTGEVKSEVTLNLKDMNTKLQEEGIERGCVLEMLRDVLGTIWDFLPSDNNMNNYVRTSKGSLMSSSPPHKRHSKDPAKPSPDPDSLQTNFENKLYSSLSCDNRYGIIFSGVSISKWFLIGPYGIEDEIPPYAELVPVASNSAERRNGKKPFVLDFPEDNNMDTEESKEEDRTQWQLVAENVVDDLVRAYKQAKKGMEEHRHVLRLVAKSGKIFFYGKYLNKMFSTDVPTSYLQHIKSKVVPSHGFCIDLEKDTYVVKVSHNTLPNSTICCKCTVNEDGRLNMYKAELNPVRHLVVDVSCMDKNLDLRLMLAAKRKITSLSEKETSDIKSLLDSATVDPNVKGGLKWPLGETLPADGYKVLDVCHVRSTIYRNGTLKLRVRETDRSNETIGTGEVKSEVTLNLKDMNTKLQEEGIERGCVLEMLRDVLGTIWDFLHCDAYLT